MVLSLRRNMKTPIYNMFFVSATLLTPFKVYAQSREWNHGHMWDWGFGMLWGPFGMLVWLGILVLLIVLLARWLGGNSSSKNLEAGEEPLQILKKRYARGEISKEEYQEMRKTLSE